MTILPSLRDRAAVTRRVDLEDDSWVVSNGMSASFICLLALPAAPNPSTVTSPRDNPAGILRYATEARGPQGGILNAGDRVLMTGGEEWEVLSRSKAVRGLRAPQGYDALVQKVNDLYPLHATVQTQGGDTDIVETDLAMWTPTEAQQPKGRYETYLAEAPADAYTALKGRNRWLVLGDQRYHVVTCSPDLAAPRAVLTLRKVDG